MYRHSAISTASYSVDPSGSKGAPSLTDPSAFAILKRYSGTRFAHCHPGGPNVDVLKVASHSSPNSVSGAIVGALEDDGVVELHAVGAGAVSQAVKAIAIARRLIGNWATRRSEPDRDSSTL
jgi:hypothetical protein